MRVYARGYIFARVKGWNNLPPRFDAGKKKPIKKVVSANLNR
jgi:hypothetical protein